MSPVDQPVYIRLAQPDDAPVIAEVIRRAFGQYRDQLTPESGALRETPAAIALELARDSDAILALRGAQLVGCVMIKPQASELYCGRLAVLPEQRGQGIARQLIEAVQAEARSRKLAAVSLSVRIVLTDNQRFFTALGFTETSRAAHPGFEYPTMIHMRKAL